MENKYTWRTTEAFPQHTEMQFEKQNLSSNFKLKLVRHNKNKQTKNTSMLLNRRGESVNNNTEKAEVLDTFFNSVSTSAV